MNLLQILFKRNAARLLTSGNILPINRSIRSLAALSIKLKSDAYTRHEIVDDSSVRERSAKTKYFATSHSKNG